MQQSILSIALADLLTGIVIVDPIWDRQITGIKLDSRDIKSGDLFIAKCGTVVDGRKYINEAIAKGAAAVIAEIGDHQEFSHADCPIFQVENLTLQIGKIAARFYKYPSRHCEVIGITGTNGKTSVSHHLAFVMDSVDQPTAVIGTVGYGRLGQLIKSPLTTPDQITLQKWLAELVDQGIKRVMMEVSSHALAQQRVNQVKYDTAIFTNLTHDHLDYHQTMQAYGEAKLKLFTQFALQYAVVNIDDLFSQTILATLSANVKVITTSQKNPKADVFAKNVECHPLGLRAELITLWGNAKLQCPLYGMFNLDNLLEVIATACLHEMPLITVLEKVAQLQPVSGRMQRYAIDSKSVFIDYAHTPDALIQVLNSLRQHFSAPIWCVFGCGGDRDRGKRPEMGAAAAKYADHIIITNDNPRHETPETIIAEIQAGIETTKSVHVEADRRLAIEFVLQHAKPHSVILIAGKGHEDYQLIGDKTLPFSDAEVIKNWAQQDPVS